MSRIDSSRMVVGYHGTDESVAAKVPTGKLDLIPSTQDYDWLGSGVYFWEQGPRRALEFAYEMAELKRNNIKNPAVIGAYINLGDCLDLLDTSGTRAIANFHRAFKADFTGLKNHRNRPDGTKLFHQLDCAVINSFVAQMKHDHRQIDTVRGCFLEGKKIYRGAEIREESHIQIAVRNLNCVLVSCQTSSLHNSARLSASGFVARRSQTYGYALSSRLARGQNPLRTYATHLSDRTLGYFRPRNLSL